MQNLSIGVAGVSGHMGTMIVRKVMETEGVALGAGSVRPGSAYEGIDIGKICKTEALKLPATANALELFETTDVVIDFTLPDAVDAHAKAARASKTPWIVGTTGVNGSGEAALCDAAKLAPVVFAPNMSLGVNLLFVLVEQVARALDDDFDIEIFEIHHNRKIDAPSGTALGLGRAAALGRGVEFDSARMASREGHTGTREKGKIGFAALRGGDIVGDHSVIFAGAGERLEIAHKAAGRHIYAAGAVRAAQWTVGRDPGLYDMKDVLGLKSQ
ncbi:MAG: 4-hydroxy-tetrahydrodipicolinate reductase [Rhodospirillaceae bacterium]|nr:4-hydroxy-tetrahydrodipicolinate reductase [Rhodospirillaceae bacterium]